MRVVSNNKEALMEALPKRKIGDQMHYDRENHKIYLTGGISEKEHERILKIMEDDNSITLVEIIICILIVGFIVTLLWVTR